MNSGRAYILAACLLLLPLRKSYAEDRADFKFSYYLEDHGRTEAFSPALLIETDLTPNTILTIQSAYDVISGATPMGEPMKRKTREVVVDVPTTQTSYVAVSGASGRGTTLVPVATSSTTTQTTVEECGKPYLPMADYEDQRWALNLGLRHRHGEWVVDAGMAYSTESDYHSLTENLIVSRDFNERMTTLSVGASLTQDNVLDTPTGDWLDKDTFECQVQLAQVIDPFTLLKVSFVAGTSWGYLDDQYKFVLLNDELIDEKRPDSRDKQIIYTSLNLGTARSRPAIVSTRTRMGSMRTHLASAGFRTSDQS